MAKRLLFRADDLSKMKLKGKIAIVTGGGQGIGLGCALELAREGSDIVLNDRPGSDCLADAAEEIRNLGVKCFPVEADAFSREGCELIAETAKQEAGDIDILVSVPAFNRRAGFLEYDPADFEAILMTALMGSFHMGQLVARHLVEKKKPGKIVFISSILAQIPNARCIAYSAAKAGLNSMTETMAVELFDHRINVNSIGPGWIDTPGERQSYSDDTMEEEAKKLPWGRMGTAEDIGKAATFLATADSDYITGTFLPVDGGYQFKHCREIPDEK